ncbi:hypothetical protein DPMN_108352 [Dreissena polymorpha]|uniref:FH2 domain-containing protein n=1 Tax=Dreissena polymorpha TaxID=45954 RepID=A0A9D4K8P3_DREPO|nr:hypothetical protein DPMN_108352 [Dreissena polymorpha]
MSPKSNFTHVLSCFSYRLRIEGLTIREEFMANMEFIKPSIDSIIEAAKDIKENKNLHELLYLVLLAGNFLNAGNYAGDAAGFKLSSLLKLTEIRANKPRMNLLHYVVMQAEEKNPALLNFPDEMKFLKDASIASVDALAADIKALDEKVAKISQNVEMVGKDFEKQMNEFLGIARKEMQELNEDLVDMEGLRIELADFFCEDEKTFKLEECFRIFQTFCERFSKAKQENAQRKDNEKKMETRRLQREAEVQKRNDADAADVTVTVEHGDGNVNIVDQLLADVRMGFKKFDEASFSVTKVQKINLGAGQNQDSLLSPTADGIGTGFVRGGSGRRSVRGVKSRKSVADGDSDSTDGQSGSGSGETGNMLFDILMQPETEPGLKTPVTEGSFSRMGSLRRRRSDRKMQGNNFGIAFERERVPSPNIEAQEKEILDTKERPKSDILDDNFDYRQGSNLSVRRSRSMNERAVLESPSRMYDPNNNKSEDNLLIERTKSPSFRSDDPHRRSSRWRNDIPDVKGLPIIEERDRNTNLVEQTSASSEYVSITDKVTKDDSFAIAEKKTKEKLSRRFSSTMLDHVEIRRVLETAEDVKNKTDEHTVAMTQRAKTNKRWVSELDKTDIDNVLKAIEETEIKIGETVKVESSVHRQSKEVVTASIQSPKEVVTASLIGPKPIDAKVVPQGDPNEPQHLKEKRKNRKKRSVLSMEDIHAAFTKTKTPDVENKTSEFENKENHELPQKSPKSPQVPPRRSRRNSDGSIEKLPEVEVKPEQTIVDKDVVSKAAKLAGKKRFRDQRFGDKETPAQKAMLEHSQGRWKSNVEKDNVDEAYRDYMNKNNMSRSKSYDEAVARKALEDESDNNAINTEKRNSLRSSAVNMYNDDRRNGKIFDDESEGDNSINITSSPRRPSSTNSTRSDSPKSSSSRLSIKSTNTSTETLRETGSDNETSPSQRRKNSTPNGITDKQYKFQVNERRPETPSSLNYLLANKVDDHSLENFEARVSFDENDDLPQAKMLKWRKQRTEKRRTGNYENVPGFDGIVSGNLSPRIEMKPESVINSPRSDSSSQGSIPIIHKTQGSFELQNDIGSRCSYASSSDSASKDEGFETMSGTVSQRTSLSSALESVDIIPGINKKFESLSKLQINENIIAEAARSSVIDTKKERTESWTEAVAVGMVIKDGSLDSSMEFNALSPDSGHGTLKEEPWQESDIIKESSEERPMSPASVHSSDKKEKKVPSYMRGTASSSKKRGQESEHDSSANLSTTNRISKGASNHNLSRARTNSNSSIVSATSNVSDSGTISPVKRRVSHGTPKERPSSIHSSMPLSRSTTPLPSSVRAQTPTNRGVAAKPATHASSTIGARLSTSSTKTLKARPAPAPPTGRKTPTPTTPARTSSKSSTSTPGRTTPVSNNRSVTPNPTRNRSTTPVNTLSHTPIRRSNSPTIEEEECEIDPNGPSPLRRTQSMRVKSGTSRPAVGSVMSSKEAPEKSSTPRRSFMSPTASSKARVDKLKAEDENSTPPIPPPRRSKDTDALPSKSDTTPSPLKRHASMRVPDKAANKAPKDQDKASDSKLKGFIQKIGGSGSKVRPVSDCSGKLAPVDENAEKDGAEELPPKEGGKSPSLRRIFGLKSKEKQVRKSTDSLKSESADVKKKSLK